jgi:hypothetical protein
MTTMPTSFALGIMKIEPVRQREAPATSPTNDFRVTAIPQADPGYIPAGGVGILRPDLVFLPKFGTSGTDTTEAQDKQAHAVICKLFVTNEEVTMDSNPNKKAYKVGLVILAANGAAKIGPFFGWVGFGSADTKTMHVAVEAERFLRGEISLSLMDKKDWSSPKYPSIKVDGWFRGVLSNETIINTKSPA